MLISLQNIKTFPDSLREHTATLRRPLTDSKDSSHTQLQICKSKRREAQCIFIRQSKNSSTYFCTGVTVLFSCNLTLCLHTFVFSAGIGLTPGGGSKMGCPPIFFLPKNSLLLATELKRANKIMGCQLGKGVFVCSGLVQTTLATLSNLTPSQIKVAHTQATQALMSVTGNHSFP